MNIRFVLISVFVLCFTTILNAQFFEKNNLYLSNDFLVGNHLGVDVAVNLVTSKKLVFQVGYAGFMSTPKSRPDDYSSSLFSLFTFGLTEPKDEINTFYIKAGKVFYENEQKSVRFFITGGIGMSNIKEATNWQPLGVFPLFSGNYSYEIIESDYVTFILNPKLEFPINRFMGFTVTSWAEMNENRFIWGIGAGIEIGILKAK